MGDSSIKSNEEQELTSYTKIFEESCPYFMAIGMSYQEFWFEDCWISEAYLKAHKIKKEQLNEQFWLQGVYIYEALIDVAPILHAFSKKGTKPMPFPKEPYPLFKKKEDNKQKEREQKIEQEKAEMFFKEWSKKVAKKFENKQ